MVDLTAGGARPSRGTGAALDAAGAERLAEAAKSAGPGVPLEEVALLSPARPRKYLAIALNYADHIAESGMEAPRGADVLQQAGRAASSAPAPTSTCPKVSDKLDYEGELAIVIGSRCRHVPAEQAAEVIAGYTIANDVSVRDWQMRAMTMTIGKSFDTHGPLGPWLVTPDELGDPQQLRHPHLRQRRAAPGRQHLRDGLRLLRAGLPPLRSVHARARRRDRDRHAGRGRRPRCQPFPEGLLKVGDTVRVEIDGIGELRNRVSPSPTGFVVDDDPPA